MVDRRTVTVEDAELTICITSTAAEDRPAAELVAKAILALQSFERSFQPPQRPVPPSPSASVDSADISWPQREQAAFQAGEAAAYRHEGFQHPPVPLATKLQNRLYLVARDKDNQVHQPALEFSSWTATSRVVEVDRHNPSKWAVYQGFPSKREAVQWQKGFDSTLDQLRRQQQ